MTGSSGSGGGLYTTGGTVTVADSTVAGNRANRAGGGIEVVGGTVTVSSSVVQDNIADGDGPFFGDGGGIHVTAGTVTVDTGSAVIRNVAMRNGGGLWNNAGFTMTHRRLRGCREQRPGPAAPNTGPDYPGDGGGGIYNRGGTVLITGESTIGDDDESPGGNHASGTHGSGGGIFTVGGAIEIDGQSWVHGND